MNRFIRLAIIAALPSIAIGCPPTPNIDTVCDNAGCISPSKLLSNLTGALSGQVVGYTGFVGTLPFFAGGQARTSSDPPALAMLPNLPTDVASLSKVITTIAVMQSLGNHNRCLTCALNSEIFSYLWPDWQKVAGPNINIITFDNLLSHRSGFRYNCDGANTTYAVLKAQIVQGVQLPLPSSPVYNNCNFAIFRELLPFMEGQTYNPQTDGKPDVWSANFYIKYVNQHVFAPLGLSARACKPPSGTNDILSYPFPAGPAHGTDWGDWTLACGGGGWVLSAGDLQAILLDLTSGNKLLTNEEKFWMNNSPCDGWDCSVRSDCPDPYVCKNGGLGNGSDSISTYMGIFKCAVPVTLIINSPTPGNQDIIDIVLNSYKGAAVPVPSGAPQPVCPVPLTPSSGMLGHAGAG